MPRAQLRFADGKVAVDLMDFTPSPGQLVRAGNDLVRVADKQVVAERIDFGVGPTWLNVVTVEKVETQQGTVARTSERRMDVVRG